MHQQIYVNLPVRDLARARAFFAAMGYAFNEQFSNAQGACLVLGEQIFVMLLSQDFFRGFTAKPLVDAHRSTEQILCLSCASRAEVDERVSQARAAGAIAARPPQDHGFMYTHGFEDLDGHLWEFSFMDVSASANPERDA